MPSLLSFCPGKESEGREEEESRTPPTLPSFPPNRSATQRKGPNLVSTLASDCLERNNPELTYVTDVSYTWPYHDHIHSVPSFSHVFGDKRQYIYINIYQETIIMILYPRQFLKPENRCLNDVSF